MMERGATGGDVERRDRRAAMRSTSPSTKRRFPKPRRRAAARAWSRKTSVPSTPTTAAQRSANVMVRNAGPQATSSTRSLRGGAAHRHQAVRAPRRRLPRRAARTRPPGAGTVVGYVLAVRSRVGMGRSLVVARAPKPCGRRGRVDSRRSAVVVCGHGGEVEGVSLSGAGARPRRRDPRNAGGAATRICPCSRSPSACASTRARSTACSWCSSATDSSSAARTAASTASASASSSSARKAFTRLGLGERARPHLEKLAAETGETAHLCILDGGGVLYLEKVEPSRTVRVPSSVGRRNPAHCTAVGKALLAHLPASGPRRAAREPRPQGLHAEHDHHPGAPPARAPHHPRARLRHRRRGDRGGAALRRRTGARSLGAGRGVDEHRRPGVSRDARESSGSGAGGDEDRRRLLDRARLRPLRRRRGRLEDTATAAGHRNA